MGVPLDTLLNLQTCDVKRIAAEARLEKAPLEIAAQQKKIKQETDSLEAARKDLLELEVARKDLDNQLKIAEEKVIKYKTQQAQVKKNEEYIAFNKEIETLTLTIDGVETQEIALLLEIDEAQEIFNSQAAEAKERIALLENEITRLKKSEEQARLELTTLTKLCEEAEAAVPEIFLQAYKQAKARAKKAPFVVPIDVNEHRCQGCHLKVSNDVFKQAYTHEAPLQCDHCGRILYIIE